jgi:ribosome-binding factor A
MDYKRSDRVADVIRREIADLLLRRVKDPRVTGLTVSEVEVTADLQHARIFYCVMGSPTAEQKRGVAAGLEKAKGFIRQELGKRLHLRYLPSLEFRYDTSLDYMDKIDRLLKELKKDE